MFETLLYYYYFTQVAGDTIYNMIKLEDSEVAEDDRPEDPHKILKTKVHFLLKLSTTYFFLKQTSPQIIHVIVAGLIQYFILPNSAQ